MVHPQQKTALAHKNCIHPTLKVRIAEWPEERCDVSHAPAMSAASPLLLEKDLSGLSSMAGHEHGLGDAPHR